jgi:hypothetical protein
MALVTLAAGDQPYQYPLRPGTPEWDNASPDYCFASMVIPQQWQESATSWQLFCSVISNPFFNVIWVIGTSISGSYDQAKSQTFSVLNTVEASPNFGVNCLRYLATVDLPTMAALNCSDLPAPACFLDYSMVCHMASLKASLDSLESLDPASLQTLFKLAVWDANYFSTRDETIIATGPARLMYAIYNRPGFPGTLPSGATLPIPLLPDQSSELDLGHLPPELIAPLATLQNTLGLVRRP